LNWLLVPWQLEGYGEPQL